MCYTLGVWCSWHFVDERRRRLFAEIANDKIAAEAVIVILVAIIDEDDLADAGKRLENYAQKRKQERAAKLRIVKGFQFPLRTSHI